MHYLSLIIAVVALIISAMTFWLTKLKKGKIKMTRPTVVYFGPDGGEKGGNKLFMRSLLYSTSEKGQYIQNMYIRLQRGESIQNFNVWVYDNNGLKRGSGLFISKTGIVCNHHFLLPKDGIKYDFLSGEYLMQVYVELVNENPKEIFEQDFIISKDQENEMITKNIGTYFDWAPNTQTYYSHLDSNPNKGVRFKRENKYLLDNVD